MRAFEDLSNEEILALTDEDIQRYCDLACAQEGAPLLPPEPGEKPVKPDHEPDVPVFSAGGEYFLSQEVALGVAEAINAGRPVTWDYAGGWPHKRITGTKEYAEAVAASRFFSAAKWEEVKGEILAHEEAKTRWEKEKKEYDEAVKARSRVTEWIWDKISEVREAERQRERFTSLLTRYLDLADGDEVVARKFLFDAHPEARDFLEPLVELRELEEGEGCPDGLLPDGEECPRCGGKRAPSGIDGGTWVHLPEG